MSNVSEARLDRARGDLRVRDVAAAAIVDDLRSPRKLLAARRVEPYHLAGGWELPGGKIDPGEDGLEALRRELREELGVEVEVGDHVPGPLPGGRWPLGGRFAATVHLVHIVEGEPTPLTDHDVVRWVDADEARHVDWLAADIPVVEEVLRRLRPVAAA